MAIGLVGRKVGMTRIFTEDGTSIPVTVIEATPNRVTQLRTEETDGYRALQVTAGTKKANRINKAEAGHFAKAGVEAGRTLVEFRLEENEGADIEVGSEITVEIFNDTKKIDVTGTSKGKGFQGVVKRHNFRGVNDATHGQHNRQRAPGSIGAASYPARVFKGMRMAGRDGGGRVKVKNLRVMKIFPEQNLILVKGAVPGHKGAIVILEK